MAIKLSNVTCSGNGADGIHIEWSPDLEFEAENVNCHGNGNQGLSIVMPANIKSQSWYPTNISDADVINSIKSSNKNIDIFKKTLLGINIIKSGYDLLEIAKKYFGF